MDGILWARRKVYKQIELHRFQNIDNEKLFLINWKYLNVFFNLNICLETKFTTVCPKMYPCNLKSRRKSNSFIDKAIIAET